MQPLQEGSSSTSEGSQEREIALHIYFYDGRSLKQENADYVEFLFAELKPDVDFRRIEIDNNNENLQKVLREELLNKLAEGEVFKYLIIDTHGLFSREEEHHPSSTYLENIGWFDENSVDSEFHKNFLPIKHGASKELQVILNSCLTFCGDKNDAQKRAQSFLNFFNADNGSIYGAQNLEYENAIYDYKYKKIRLGRGIWQEAAEDFGTGIRASMTLSLILAPYYFDNMSLSNSIVTLVPIYIRFGVITSVAGFFLRSIGKATLTFTRNRGYLFTFKNGAPDHSFRVFKIRDMRKLVSGKFCKNSTKKQ
ncbi:MAG: hypothetical protein VX642_07305 [Bdellovibrionota bacterium]|nr:hypothetical protein [Bdellovibrionota bacterium]